MFCEDEVKGYLKSAEQFDGGPTALAKGSAFNDANAFIVEDGNYISGRWPGGKNENGGKVMCV